MIPNQPIRFEPLFRSYIWGGTRLKTVLNKPIPSSGVWAESWEIVDHGDDQSVVNDGPWQEWTLRQLIESFPQEIIGPTAVPSDGFPLLLKYLDCQRVLSLQVHPDDSYALKMTPPDLGKTEAWYVLESTEEAVIYAGLKEGVDREQLTAALADGTAESCLHSFHPEKGDCVFIPAGVVHALGEGLIVAEIQQASDTTFRLFDWNRLGADGKPRPLHIEQALEVIDFRRGPIHPVSSPAPLQQKSEIVAPASSSVLVDCEKFLLIEITGSTYHSLQNQFGILTVVKGNAILSTKDAQPTALHLGNSILLPAACEGFSIELETGAIVLLAMPPIKP